VSYYVKNPDGEVLDFVSDAERVELSMPRYEGMFDAIAEVAERNDELAVMGSWGRQHFKAGMARVASIPPSLLNGMLMIQPDLLASKDKFYAWLDRHPEYQTIRRTG
jgi:hypothetical protein